MSANLVTRHWFSLASRWVASCAVLVSGSLAGCAGSESSELGGEWKVLDVVSIADDTGGALTPDLPITWTFDASGECSDCDDATLIAGSDGCNDFRRSARLDEETNIATWGSYWETTAAACDGPLATAIAVIMDANGFEWSQEANNTVVVTDETGSVRMRLQRT